MAAAWILLCAAGACASAAALPPGFALSPHASLKGTGMGVGFSLPPGSAKGLAGWGGYGGAARLSGAAGRRVCMQAEPSQAASSSSSKILSFLCPVLKLLSNTDPTAPRNTLFESLTVALSSASRPLWGREASPLAASGNGLGGAAPPVLYEFEACPFCRRVRETLTHLDIEAEVRPCPKGSRVYRAEALSLGGKEAFPFLWDPNTGGGIYESADVVDHLVRKYGGGAERPPLLLESTLISGWVPTLARGGRGMTRWEGATGAPAQPITLFSAESDGGSRLVREALCELELPYTLVSVGEGSKRGRARLEAAGGGQVPFLVDPNAGVSLGGADAINGHLFAAYTVPVDHGGG